MISHKFFLVVSFRLSKTDVLGLPEEFFCCLIIIYVYSNMHVQIKKFSSKVSSRNVYRENKMYKQVYWKIKNVQTEMRSL